MSGERRQIRAGTGSNLARWHWTMLNRHRRMAARDPRYMGLLESTLESYRDNNCSPAVVARFLGSYS